ncbi:MAG: transcription elongation factor GreA, partial [Bryobacterales bacterium]|nr:transcription elongation factor GreA [Bryobacterales bacterium]
FRGYVACPRNWVYNGYLGVVLSGMEELKKKLQEEIAALEHEFRSELPKEILKARAHGDLSENAEYHAAKDRQGYVNARLGQLRKRLAEFSMVDVARIPHDKVGLGSSVVVLDYQKDQETTYRLVPSEETDVKRGLISTSSPIGRGLLGKAVGDVVRIQSPGGFREMEILRLTTIHDQL